MRILVTGGTGFVGHAIAQELISSGHDVIVTTRQPRAAQDESSGAQVITDCDLSERGSIQRLPSRVDVVVHSAALAEFRDRRWEAHLRNNVAATRNAVLWAATAGASRFIFMSTIGVHDRKWGHPTRNPITETSPLVATSAYGKSKRLAEQVVAGGAVPSTTFRLSWVYGARMRRSSHVRALARMAAEHPAVSRLPLPGRVSVIAASDVAIASRQVLESTAALPQHDVVLLAEDTPVGFRQILNPRCADVDAPRPGFITRAAASVLPFGIRSLFDDALVCSNARMHERGFEPAHRFADEYPRLLTTEGWLA